jgi:hypothetical protein
VEHQLFFTINLARWKLSKYYAGIIWSTAQLLSSSHILDPIRKLQLGRKWDKWLDMHPEDETSYPTQSQEAFLKYLDKEYFAKHWLQPVNNPDCKPSNNLVPSSMALWSIQSSFDLDDMSRDDEEYLMPKIGARMTPRWSNRAVWLLTAARRSLNSPSEAPANWAQNNTNLNGYHSDAIAICSTFWILDITNWWCQ